MKMVRILTVTLNPALDKFVEVLKSKRGKSNQTRTVGVFPGGKGVNVSRALKALGVQSVPFVAVAGDNGRKLATGLRAEGFRPVLLEISGETRVNTTVLKKSSGAVTRILEAGPRWSKVDVERLRKAFPPLLRKVDIVVFSGSLPPGVPVAMYRELITCARRCGVRACLDTSGRPLRAGIKARPFLVKPNRAEAEEMVGRRFRSRDDIRKALQFLISHGMKEVILTLGPDGLAGHDSTEFYRVKSPRLRGQTVGCGDAALAGALAGIVRKEDFICRLKSAAACGAANVLSKVPGGISKKTVRRILQDVKPERL